MEPLGRPGPERPRFDTPNILWFFGGFVAAAAGGGVLAQVPSSARGAWILLAALGCSAALAALAAALLRAGWEVPGGVLATMAVTFAPVAAGAFEKLVGVWPHASPLDPLEAFQGWLFALPLVTAAAGLVAFALVRFHFALALVAFSTFLAAELLLPVFVSAPGPGDHASAFVVTGAALLAVGIALDLRAARRAAFWWHLVGLLALAAGLSYHAFRHASWGWILILVAGTLLLLLAASLARATWGVFGVLGFFAPIAHYLDVWLGNLAVAFALAGVGLGLVVLGIAVRLLWRPFQPPPLRA